MQYLRPYLIISIMLLLMYSLFNVVLSTVVGLWQFDPDPSVSYGSAFEGPGLRWMSSLHPFLYL